MADEISVTASLTCNKTSIMTQAIARSVTGLVFSMSANVFIFGSVSIGTSEEAIPLGEVTTPHWAFFQNHDATNYIQLYNGAAGAVFLRLLKGEVAFCPLDPGSVPYAKANTLACLLEYLIFGA